LLVRELGQVVVGEVGSTMQLGGRDEGEDLGSLAVSSSAHGWSAVVVGSSGVHVSSVAGSAGGSLSIRLPK
jgi:hypothetical protein